jgi:hypothetical protein
MSEHGIQAQVPKSALQEEPSWEEWSEDGEWDFPSENSEVFPFICNSSLHSKSNGFQEKNPSIN